MHGVITDVLEDPNEEQLKIINKDLNVDLKKFQENEALFLNWLKNHQTLPKQYEIRLIRNFIRLCKNNLEKAKSKYENYISVRETIPELYQNRCLDENSFVETLSHRSLTVVSTLTPDCYRILLLKLPKLQVTGTEANECLRYILMQADFGLSHTTEAGHIIIIDFIGFNMSHARQINFSMIKKVIHLIIKVYPSRLRKVHLLNVNYIVSSVIGIVKYFLPGKLRQRLIVHKEVNELLEYFEPHLIPSDYGGTDISTEDNTERARRFYIGQREWILNNEEMKPLIETN